MKMHGLGDGPYWIISYAYFLAISLIYMLCFVVFGSLVGNILTTPFNFRKTLLSVPLNEINSIAGLKFFTLNDYSIQFVFYFIYINLQIVMAFLAAAMFSNVKTATGLT